MTTNFLELATTLKYLEAKWLPEKKVSFTPCEDHPQFADIFIHVIKLWPDETHDKVVLLKILEMKVSLLNQPLWHLIEGWLYDP